VGALSTPGLYTVPFSQTAAFAGGLAAVPNPRHMDENMVSPYYEQFHFGTQREFAHGYVYEPEYIGTMGHKLTGYRDINTFNGRTIGSAGVLCGAAACSSNRINSNIGADNYRSNDYSSNYHALQLTVRKQYSHGLSFNSSYTWSKALDTLSDAFNSREGATVTDTMNIKADYGPADFYIKHRFVTSLSYDLPFFRQNRWIGGWTADTIVTLQSGVPFTPYSSASAAQGYDLNKNGLATDRVVPTTAPGNTYTGGNPADGYIDVSAWGKDPVTDSITYYTCPASINNGQWCDAPIGRNSVIGPGYANVDFNLVKKFRINERSSVSFQANFFNLFNRANFDLPDANITSSSFGQSVATFSPRVTQLALRFDF
jgi:hypothetical protein